MTAERAAEICRRLEAIYPGTRCFLEFEEPYHLLIATILSAQCTDERVNAVTKTLFGKYTSPEAFANADRAELEMDIRSTGFYKNKAKGIIGSMRMLIDDWGGVLPSDISALTRFPSVGRKTANVVRTHVFGIPSIAVDTHVGRVSRRMGLVTETDPVKVEHRLMDILPRECWSAFNVRVISLGREVCKARSPRCDICGFRDICEKHM